MKGPARRSGAAVLLVRAGSRRAALPLAAVGETMRPLPVEPLPGMPPFVLGVAVVRAEPIPVVDLEALLGGAAGAPGRFVTVRAEAGAFALAVTEVLGIRDLAADTLRELPLLLGAEAAAFATAAASHDGRLVTLLSAARLVPAEVWQALAARGAAA